MASVVAKTQKKVHYHYLMEQQKELIIINKNHFPWDPPPTWNLVQKVLKNKVQLTVQFTDWSLSRHGAGGGLGRLLQDGLASQVIGQSAVRAPDCELAVDPHLDHLLLPGDGDVPRGELAEKILVLVFQLHAFNGGEGPDVVNVLGINCLRVWHERWRKDPCGDAAQEDVYVKQKTSSFCVWPLCVF